MLYTEQHKPQYSITLTGCEEKANLKNLSFPKIIFPFKPFGKQTWKTFIGNYLQKFNCG